jgi:hypothetical protein
VRELEERGARWWHAFVGEAGPGVALAPQEVAHQREALGRPRHRRGDARCQ